MNRHLTEIDLIEYQFNLASADRTRAIAEHLAGCSDCRRCLEKLKQKFAPLELLKEEPRAAEELIEQTLEGIKRPAKSRIIKILQPQWIVTAAAVLLVGLGLLVIPMKREKYRSIDHPFAKDLPKEKLALALDDKVEKPPVTALDSATAKIDRSAPTETEAIPNESSNATVSAGRATKEAIQENPPFAPASAIELVTLPRRDNVQITIYNSADLTLVREKRNLTLKKGWNWLQFMWANTLIDPTSLNLEPLDQQDKIDIQQLVFPARLREIGRWLIRSEIEGQVPFEITYFTSGLGWRAFYMGTLTEDEKSMHLAGYVRVANNSGEDYENAQTRLIVGEVHILDKIAELARRQYPYGRPSEEDGRQRGLSRAGGFFWAEGAQETAMEVLGRSARGPKPKEIKKEGLSEYFLYTIEGTETIENNWAKRLQSFEAKDVEIKNLYKYDEERWGNQSTRFVAFINDKKHNLGQTPIPNGSVKIYSQADANGGLSYLGGTEIKYIPVDEEVELNLGPARLVSVEPILMDAKQENFLFDNKGDISGWDEVRTWNIEITNTCKLPVELEITRGFDTPYWTLALAATASTVDDAVSYKKHDATHVRFEIKLPPQKSKRSFGYTVRTYHGLREQQIN